MVNVVFALNIGVRIKLHPIISDGGLCLSFGTELKFAVSLHLNKTHFPSRIGDSALRSAE